MSEVGKELIEAAKQALAHIKGEEVELVEHRVHIPEEVDVHHIRKELHMSQKTFANTFGFSVNSVQNWEQRRRRPQGPARTLLMLIAAEPNLVVNTLNRHDY